MQSMWNMFLMLELACRVLACSSRPQTIARAACEVRPRPDWEVDSTVRLLSRPSEASASWLRQRMSQSPPLGGHSRTMTRMHDNPQPRLCSVQFTNKPWVQSKESTAGISLHLPGAAAADEMDNIHVALWGAEEKEERNGYLQSPISACQCQPNSSTKITFKRSSI